LVGVGREQGVADHRAGTEISRPGKICALKTLERWVPLSIGSVN